MSIANARSGRFGELLASALWLSADHLKPTYYTVVGGDFGIDGILEIELDGRKYTIGVQVKTTKQPLLPSVALADGQYRWLLQFPGPLLLLYLHREQENTKIRLYDYRALLVKTPPETVVHVPTDGALLTSDSLSFGEQLAPSLRQVCEDYAHDELLTVEAIETDTKRHRFDKATERIKRAVWRYYGDRDVETVLEARVARHGGGGGFDDARKLLLGRFPSIANGELQAVCRTWNGRFCPHYEWFVLAHEDVISKVGGAGWGQLCPVVEGTACAAVKHDRATKEMLGRFAVAVLADLVVMHSVSLNPGDAAAFERFRRVLRKFAEGGEVPEQGWWAFATPIQRFIVRTCIDGKQPLAEDLWLDRLKRMPPAARQLVAGCYLLSAAHFVARDRRRAIEWAMLARDVAALLPGYALHMPLTKEIIHACA